MVNGRVAGAIVVAIGLASRAPAAESTAASDTAAAEMAQITDWNTAAENGEAAAQYNLALVYLEGSGVPAKATVQKNNAKAVSLMSKAAAQDYVPAMYYLGIIYSGGFGVEEDLAESYCWFERTAKSAYPQAYFALGKMNFEGTGVPRDLIKAHAFLILGDGMGHQPSKALLQQVLDEIGKSESKQSFVDKSVSFLNEWSALRAPDCVLPIPEAKP
jgi:TPR repeat protein